jgi:hypothetical protein
MSRRKRKQKKLIINAKTSNLEVVIGEVEKESVSLHFGQSYKLEFDTSQDWAGFVKYIVQLNPSEQISLFLKPILQQGDLIQWDDGAIGLVLNVSLDKEALSGVSRVEFFGENEDEEAWIYTIKWNDRKELTSLKHSALKESKYNNGKKRWKLLSRAELDEE